MSIHIGAQKDEIAENILLPGDPLRAKYIAKNFLTDVVQYNEVRGMYGYTGVYKGEKISVQGTGMGIPSISIYVTELIQAYECKNLIRIGTLGGMKREVKIRDIVLAMAASHDSNANTRVFPFMTYAPHASFSLLEKAYQISKKYETVPVHVGAVYTGDLFYEEDESHIEKLADYGVLGVDMETSGLYTLGAKYGVNTLSIMTVSDHLLTGEETTSDERQTTFHDMITIALETLL
ncbi:MAG TPA: purine-nucleoside phosphorylase [Firmicutes bacterium]|nr:purine-nucleoside phosphorylase [Bacillota bacterium]